MMFMLASHITTDANPIDVVKSFIKEKLYSDEIINKLKLQKRHIVHDHIARIC